MGVVDFPSLKTNADFSVVSNKPSDTSHPEQ